MGETAIEWADYTFNPWIGCEKVSAGCKHCYAERDTSNRVSTARGLPLWGPSSTRRRTSEANWREPLLWNKQAKALRAICEREAIPFVRPRVFCASLADVFEDRPELATWRTDLFNLIERCDELDWLLVTKRPENVREMVPFLWSGSNDFARSVGTWPKHVWLGTTVEDRKALTRIDDLRNAPAVVRFLSIEPLLEDLGTLDLRGISWVIVGGESGPKARPMLPAWVRSIRGQCRAAGVPFFFKQWGEWSPIMPSAYRREDVALWNERTDKSWVYLRDLELDRREAWDEHEHGDVRMYKVGKKAAGRTLDERTWDEVPHGS